MCFPIFQLKPERRSIFPSTRRVIVLPERTDIPLPVLKKLEKLVRDGATVIGPKPARDTSLADYPRCDEQVKTLAEKMWGSNADGQASGRSYGKGRVIADRRALPVGPRPPHGVPCRPGPGSRDRCAR